MPRNLLQFFFRRFFRRDSLEHDLGAELESHVAIEVQQRIERGDSAEVARQRALREFGNVGLVSEVTRDMWGFTWLEELVQDSRYAVRMLRKSPALSCTVMLMLALGIGATTTIFSLVNGVLLRPLSFPLPNQLVMLWEVPPQTNKPNVVALNNFVAWKERARSFQSMAAFVSLPMNLVSPQQSEQVPGLAVTSEFFSTLGTPPILGRTFRPGEYDRQPPREVVLSYRTWQSRFGGSRDVIGKKISVDVTHHEIVGVMPPGFGFPNVEADLYTPLAITLDDGRNYSVLGRLRPGVSIGAAKAEIASIASHTAKENVDLDAGWSATVVPLLDQTIVSVRPVFLALFAAVGLILLLACANIANLLLMRAAVRSREISLRLALGASKSRIVRQLLVENLLLGTLGGAAGIAIAAACVRIVRSGLPQTLQVPRLNEVALDLPVLAFSVAVTVLSCVLFGLAPTIQALKRDLIRDLHAVTRSITSERRLRRALVVAEVGLAVLLTVAAGDRKSVV